MPDVPDDDRIGREIAQAHEAPDPTQVAAVIIKALFENGPNRLPGPAKFVAVQTVAVALEVWRKQLLAAKGNAELESYKKAYKDTKEELENLKLYLAVKQKEGKLG